MRYRLVCSDAAFCRFECWAGSPELAEILAAAHQQRTNHPVEVILSISVASIPVEGKGADERRPS